MQSFVEHLNMIEKEMRKRRFTSNQGGLQWAWRTGSRREPNDQKRLEELEWAVVDALAMGGVIALPGDGVGCAAQIADTQYMRAEKATKELEEERRYRRQMQEALEYVSERIQGCSEEFESLPEGGRLKAVLEEAGIWARWAIHYDAPDTQWQEVVTPWGETIRIERKKDA